MVMVLEGRITGTGYAAGYNAGGCAYSAYDNIKDKSGGCNREIRCYTNV